MGDKNFEEFLYSLPLDEIENAKDGKYTLLTFCIVEWRFEHTISLLKIYFSKAKG
jgi:hypothetical protein